MRHCLILLVLSGILVLGAAGCSRWQALNEGLDKDFTYSPLMLHALDPSAGTVGMTSADYRNENLTTSSTPVSTGGVGSGTGGPSCPT